jgi:hypothetical protein
MPEPISATIIAAWIMGGTSLVAGGANAASNASANAKNLEMAMLQRKDTLAAQKTANMFTREGLALNKRQQNLAEENSAYAKKEATEQKGYSRMQTAYERAAKLLSDNMNLNQAKAAPFQKYAPGRA